MKTKEAKVIRLLASSQVNQVNEGDLFITDSREHNWGKLEALKCERLTSYGHAWNGSGIQTYINHLYFTTDDYIKKGDNMVRKDYDTRYEGDQFKDLPFNQVVISGIDTTGDNQAKKIIATTDKSLNLPQPSQAFIEKYVKVGGIDEVMVEYEYPDNKYLDVIEVGVRKAFKDTNKPLQIKVDAHNTITIHTIKNSWNREEIETLLDAELKAYEEDTPHSDDRCPQTFVERFLNNL